MRSSERNPSTWPRQMAVALTLCAGASACAPMDAQPLELGDDKADGFSAEALVDGTPGAVGILALINDAGTDHAFLDDVIGLDRRAADHIVAHRDARSPFDDPFDSMAELTALPYVGNAALEALYDYAWAEGWTPRGHEVLASFDGVTLTVHQAERVLAVVGSLSIAELETEVGLDRNAATLVAAARPLRSCSELAAVAGVDGGELSALRDWAGEEVGIVSDLDKTIIPPAPSGQEFPAAPYAGMPTLLSLLEGRRAGRPGDMAFVTARTEEGAEGVPEWLETHGVPSGPIETGISGVPHVAQAEKVKDITKVLEENPYRRFVLFGDSNHRDPDAYREIQAAFGERILAAFIHDVKTIEAERLEGLVVFQHYGEVAGHLFEMRLLSEDEARAVMTEVAESGEEDFTLADIEPLLDAHR